MVDQARLQGVIGQKLEGMLPDKPAGEDASGSYGYLTAMKWALRCPDQIRPCDPAVAGGWRYASIAQLSGGCAGATCSRYLQNANRGIRGERGLSH